MHASLRGEARSPLTIIIDHAGKGCEVGTHTEAVPQDAPLIPKPATTEILTMSESKDGKEVYSAVQTVQSSHTSHSSAPIATTLPTEPAAPYFEEEDDSSIAVAPGTQCRRKGCAVAFLSDAENRVGNGEGTVCIYHSAPVRLGFFVTFTNTSFTTDRINSFCSPSSARGARYVTP